MISQREALPELQKEVCYPMQELKAAKEQWQDIRKDKKVMRELRNRKRSYN